MTRELKHGKSTFTSITRVTEIAAHQSPRRLTKRVWLMASTWGSPFWPASQPGIQSIRRRRNSQALLLLGLLWLYRHRPLYIAMSSAGHIQCEINQNIKTPIVDKFIWND